MSSRGRSPIPGELPAVVLAIDPGATSGWAIMVGAHASREARLRGIGRMRVVAYGAVKVSDLEALKAIVTRAIDVAKSEELPLVVARETWNGRFRKERMHPKTIAGLGKQWGRWEVVLELAGVPKVRVVSVGQSTWRGAVLGTPRMRTDVAKRRASAYARTLLGLDHDAPISDDAAEALCIGLWGLRAEKVWKLLPKRFLRGLDLPVFEPPAKAAE